jgi:hypothetical protein
MQQVSVNGSLQSQRANHCGTCFLICKPLIEIICKLLGESVGTSRPVDEMIKYLALLLQFHLEFSPHLVQCRYDKIILVLMPYTAPDKR